MNDSGSIDFYFDFSSPYGYFASTRIDALAARHGRVVRWRPYLMGIALRATGRRPLVEHPLLADYTRHDTTRTARYHGIEFRFPEPFPLQTVSACRAYYWLQEQDTELAKRCAAALLRAYFVDGRNISLADVVVSTAASLGAESAAVTEALGDDAVKQRLRVETDAAIAAGVFGSPFIIVDGEPFWGNDRLEQVDRWLATGGW